MNNALTPAIIIMDYIKANNLSPDDIGMPMATRIADLGLTALMVKVHMLDSDEAVICAAPTIDELMEDMVTLMGYKSRNRYTTAQKIDYMLDFMAVNWSHTMAIIVAARMDNTPKLPLCNEEETLFEVLSEALLDYMPTATGHLTNVDF